MSGFPLKLRLIKESKSQGKFMDVIVVGEDQVILEATGEVHPRSDLPAIVAGQPPSLVIAQGAERVLLELHQVFQDDPSWNYTVKPIHPKGNGHHGSRITGTVVRSFGWKVKHGHGKRDTTRYHVAIDPFPFCAGRISELITIPGLTETSALYLWGTLLRDWLQAQDLPVSPSAGAIAAHLIRSPLWWEPARKVPRATNARLRPFLPGNHYRLYTELRRSHQAVKLDMSSAHHRVAASLPLPSADSFVIRGHIPRDTGGTGGTVSPWCSATSRRFRVLTDSHHGFLYVRATVPHKPAGGIHHPIFDTPGRQDIGVWTTALPHLVAQGLVIEGVHWAATTPQLDTALNAYAQWCLAELDAIGDHPLRPTVKRILLAGYGIKAATANRMERGVLHSDTGETGAYPAGPGVLPVKRLRLDTETEPLLVHVAHRAMIEEGLRVLMIEEAQALETAGFRVLCIYADALMVETRGETLPMMVGPWKPPEPLTNLRFMADNGTAYVAEEEERLPGISREDRDFLDRLRRLASVRNN
jgi:hypothetical protein